jgi:hypothetical protein
MNKKNGKIDSFLCILYMIITGSMGSRTIVRNDLRTPNKMNLKTKKRIIDKYFLLLNEFFTLVIKSSVIKEMNYPSICISIGINSIHRVFEFILLKTQSLENAYYYSQKTYYYYLEYMEQLYQSNMTLNLNHMDAVLFVYKKTIFNDDNQDESNSIANMMSLQNNTIQFDEIELKHLFMRLLKISNIIFHWTNMSITFENRKQIYENHFYHFSNFLINNNLVISSKKIDRFDLVLSYLEIIQQKIKMDFSKYDSLLRELSANMSKMKKTKNVFLDESEKNELFLIKFYVEESVFFEKFETGDMEEFIKWLV